MKIDSVNKVGCTAMIGFSSSIVGVASQTTIVGSITNGDFELKHFFNATKFFQQ